MASSAPAHWARYETFKTMSPGDRIASPPSAPLPYFAGWPRRKSRGNYILDEIFGTKTALPKSDGSGFFGFVRRASDDGSLSGETKSGGWKFHLSIHPDDIPLAWDSIVPLIEKEGIGGVKFATPGTAAEHSIAIDEESGLPNPQLGKMIVLYTNKEIDGKPAHTPKDWQRILQSIEQQLAEAGVRPGPEVATDRPVPGSQYTYYRSSSVDRALEKAFVELKDANLEPAIAHAAQQFTPQFQGDNHGLDRAIEEYIEHLPPKEKVMLPRQQRQEILRQHIPLEAGFTPKDIEAITPDINAELDEIRHAILKLPREKRHKLPSEQDIYADIRIENPHMLRAEQQRQARHRGIGGRE